MQVSVYRVGDFAIHVTQRRLMRLGQPVECEPRVFDLIVYLIGQRERAVDKNELIAHLWNGRPVSDASLSQVVYKARKVLGGDTNACIQTVHGHGFRWIAAVVPVAASPTAAAAAAAPQPAVATAVAQPALPGAAQAAAPTAAAGDDCGALRVPASPAAQMAAGTGLPAAFATAMPAVAPMPSPLAAPTPAAAQTPTAPETPTPAPPRTSAAPAPPRIRYRRWLGAAAAVLLAGLILTGWPVVGHRADAAAPARLLVLPVDVAGGLEELSWARLGMMGLVANALETEAGLAIVDPAIVRRLAVGDAGSPVRRRTWREATGAGYSLTLRLSRAGPLLQLDATLDGAEGTQQRSLFGEEAGRLALDMSAVVRGWLDPRPRGEAPPGELDGEVAATYALGTDAYLRGDLDAARPYFTLCVARSPEALQPRLQLAAVELKYAAVQRAAELVEEVLQRVDAAHPPQFAVDAQRMLGEVELQRGRIDAAQAALERARALLPAAAAPAQRAAILESLAHVAARSGRYAEAAAQLQQAQALFSAAGNAVGETQVWISMGVLERMRGRTGASEAALLRALGLARASDVPWQQSLAVARLVQLRVNQRRFREAVQLGEPALRQLQPPAPRDTRTERLLLLEIANARLELGQAAVAYGYATRALTLAEKGADATGAAMARVMLAQAGVALQQPRALEIYRKAIDDCVVTGQLPRAAYHIAVLARLQRRAGDADGLRASVAWVQRLAASAQASDMSAYAAAAQAQLAAHDGRGGEALQRLRDARSTALQAEDRVSAEDLALEHTMLALELDQPEAAGATLAELGPESEAEGDALALAEAWRRARGELADADRLFRRRDELDAQLPRPDAALLDGAAAVLDDTAGPEI